MQESGVVIRTRKEQFGLQGSPVRLPSTSIRQQFSHAHVVLLRSVLPEAPYNTGFEGTIYRPGSWVEDCPNPAVAVECVGPVEPLYRRNRPRRILWILWKYDWKAEDWKEIARAQAFGWEWATVLRIPAIQALHEEPELVDVIAKGQELTEELLAVVDLKLAGYDPLLKKNVLTMIYDRIAGRIGNVKP